MRIRTIIITVIFALCCAMNAAAQEVPDRQANQRYLGVTIFMPGGINGAYMQDLSDKYGIKVSLGYVGNNQGDYIAGGEIDLLERFSRKGHFRGNWILGVGHSTIQDCCSTDQWTYVVSGLNVRLFGFFAQTGISYGFGDFSNPQLLLEAGFLVGI